MSADGSRSKKPRAGRPGPEVPAGGSTAAPLAPPPPAGPVLFLDAMQSFLQENSGFESSVAIEAMINEIRGAQSLDQAFLTPLRHKMLNFEGALKWAFLLHHGQKRAVEDDIPFPGGPLDLSKAYEGISQVYDIALLGALWDHFEGESSDDEEDESSGEEE